MKATLTQSGCTLTREPGDKRIAKESTVVFHMRNCLNAQGFHFVRIYPENYGLTSCRLGLADHKAGILLWHERYAIEDAAQEFNQSGKVFFQRVDSYDPAEDKSHPKRLTAKEAYDIASSWGSYMRDGDPGAVFYTFSADKVVVQNEDHRSKLIAYTDNCLKNPGTPANRRDLVRLRYYFATACVPSESQLDPFTCAYIEAALWSTNDESDESGGIPLDTNFSISDLDRRTFNAMASDCRTFQQQNAELLVLVNYTGKRPPLAAQAGHDFWLTRNHHGAGFWDGDWSEQAGEQLTKAAHAYPQSDLYVGDDGKLYL